VNRCLVLGGPGFVGQAACKELMRRGFETIAASRTHHPFGTFTSHRVVDRRDEDRLRQLLEEVRPDVLLDLACERPADVAAVERSFRGERYVLVSCGIRAGSGGPLGPQELLAPDAGAPPAGGSDPGEAGRRCETLVVSGSLPWTILRPPAITGAFDPSLRIAAYIQRVEDGGPVLVPEETYQQPLELAWVRDVGHACALACDLRRPVAGRAYHVAFDGVTLEDLLLAIGRALGRTPELVPVPYAEMPSGASPYGPDPARPAGPVLDRERSELGFEPSTLEDALAETLAWYLVARPSHPGYGGRAGELELARRWRRA